MYLPVGGGVPGANGLTDAIAPQLLTGHLRLAVPLPLAAAAIATDDELKSSDGLNAEVLRSNESRRAVSDDVFNANPDEILIEKKNREKKRIINKMSLK